VSKRAKFLNALGCESLASHLGRCSQDSNFDGVWGLVGLEETADTARNNALWAEILHEPRDLVDLASVEAVEVQRQAALFDNLEGIKHVGVNTLTVTSSTLWSNTITGKAKPWLVTI
jgi:hypothetical protein